MLRHAGGDEPVSDDFDLTLEQAATVYALVAAVLVRMEDHEVEDRKPSSPVPRGVINCGQLNAIVPLTMALLCKHFPQLLDEDTLDAALRLLELPHSSIN